MGVTAGPDAAAVGAGRAAAAVGPGLTVLVSASRSGSSSLAHLLRHDTTVPTLPVEAAGLLRERGLVPEASADDSATLSDDGSVAAFAASLQDDLGFPAEAVDEGFAAGLRRALARQWGGGVAAVSMDRMRHFIRSQAGRGALPIPIERWRARFPTLLSDLAADGHRVSIAAYDPWFSEVGAPDLGQWLPERIIEEPPFVIPAPSLPRAEAGVAPLVGVVKGPSEAYRLPFWAKVAGPGRLRILHLVRDPLPSICSLMEGWRSTAFHSAAVPGGLAIPGYSDVSPDGGRWWKFDRPPGWQDWTGRPLGEVCAFQWLSAHRHVIDFAECSGMMEDGRYLSVSLEQLIADRAERSKVLSLVTNWLAAGDVCDAVAGGAGAGRWGCFPRVMGASSVPASERWWRAAGEAAAAIRDTPGVAAMARQLGYDVA